MKKLSVPLLIFALSIPLIAGFFAWQKKSFDFKHLSTQQASESGAIMKAEQGIPLFGFLTKSFGAQSSSTTDAQNSALHYESLYSTIKNLERGTFTTSPADDPGQNDPQQAEEPTEEPARSVYRYFVASSAVGFGDNTESLASALSRAAQGNSAPLTTLIAGLSEQLSVLRALPTPPEVGSIHERSNLLLSEYINFLKRIAESSAQNVTLLWESQEHARLIREASSILQAIRNIETTYEFTLPDDVLPH